MGCIDRVSIRLALSVGGLVVGLLVLSGCGRSSYVGRKYDDFTAYYNQFHNAEEAYDEGVESLRRSNPTVDRTEYLSLFLVPSGNGEESFEEAVQKSARVLREHPNSKWADDALLLIGKSYFFQQNNVGAVEKFREAIQLGTDRETEARFWLARSLVAADQFGDAEEVLRAATDAQEEPDPWTARMHLVRGELFVRRQQWEAAADALEAGLQRGLPDRPASRASFLLGQVCETLKAPERAREAYRAVQDYGPRYELGFAAQLNDIELQGRVGDTEAALDRLDALEDDDKNRELHDRIALVRARIYRANDRLDAGEEALTGFLYGEDTPTSVSSKFTGRLHYELASIYRAEGNYGQAAAHYDTARTAMKVQGGRAVVERGRHRLPDAPTDAGAQADRFLDLAEHAQEVARLDSLLRLGRMGEEELRARIAELRARRQSEEESKAETGRRGPFEQGQPRAVRERQQAGTAVAQTRDSEAGFLFHNDPSRVQEGRRQFRRTWGNRPRVDDWRRRIALQERRPAQAEEEAEVGPRAAPERAPGEGGGSEEAARASVQIDVSVIPRDSVRQAKMEANRAVARYELANALFLAAGRPDSAETWYRRIIDEDENHEVADRARYALAEAHRAQGDTAAAWNAYRAVLRAAPDSRLAERAREQLGRTRQQAGRTQSAQADTAYARAYATWQAGHLDSALVDMLDVVRRFPETRSAPRALLASGVLYWQQAQRDPGAAPRSLLRRHLADLGRDSVASPQEEARPATSPPTDTAALAGEGRDAPPDSTGDAETTDSAATQGPRVEDQYEPLETVLSLVAERYPNAPQAKRAEALLAAVEERRATVNSRGAEDEASVPTDSTPDSNASVDSTLPPVGPEQAFERRKVSAGEGKLAPDSTSTDSREGEDRENKGELGGWTLSLYVVEEEARAVARARTTERRLGSGEAVEVLPDSSQGGVQYRVVVGRYADRQAAARAQRRVGEQLSVAPELWKSRRAGPRSGLQ